jgi:hypothetical protein
MLNLHRYVTHCYNHPDSERASGVMAIIVKDFIYCVPVTLSSLLQVIAVYVHLPVSALLCVVFNCLQQYQYL